MWSDHDGSLWDVLTRNQVLDNITLYWFTRTGASSARLYWRASPRSRHGSPNPRLDKSRPGFGCTVFPREDAAPVSSVGRASLLNLVRGATRTGWTLRRTEQPGLFVAEVRAVAQRRLTGDHPTQAPGGWAGTVRSATTPKWSLAQMPVHVLVEGSSAVEDFQGKAHAHRTEPGCSQCGAPAPATSHRRAPTG